MIGDAARRGREPFELSVEERHVERRVVNDEFGAAQEFEQLARDFREARLAREELRGQSVHLQGARVDLAIGAQVTVEHPARTSPVHDLDATDLDDAVALLGLEARGFGVEDDLTHGVGSDQWLAVSEE